MTSQRGILLKRFPATGEFAFKSFVIFAVVDPEMSLQIAFLSEAFTALEA